jgi:hypothetical protein
VENEELLGNARSVTGDQPKCKDCAHYKLYPADPVLIYSWPSHRCTAATDLVTGKTIETDCYAMRHDGCECGQVGKLFKDADAPANGEKPTAASGAARGGGIGDALRALLLVLGALGLLALIFWGYGRETDPPKVIKTGEVSLKRKVSAKDRPCCVTARTRLMAGSSLWQVEVSPGDWKNCGDDCEKALRVALDR